MRIIGIIPARYGSTRFPGKPLAKIRGRAMIARVVELARQSRVLHEVLVATDDERIAVAAKEAGAKAIVTEGEFASGTDRVAAVARTHAAAADVIVNIQGDEPLLPPEGLARLVAPFAEEDVRMTTLAAPFAHHDELSNPRAAKVVVDDRGNALYFSRAPIPCFYRRGDEAPPPIESYLRHIGVYGYRADTLEALASAPPSALERIEGLEQLRALAMGVPIRVARICHGTIGVDTPEDLRDVERELARIEELISSGRARG